MMVSVCQQFHTLSSILKSCISCFFGHHNHSLFLYLHFRETSLWYTNSQVPLGGRNGLSVHLSSIIIIPHYDLISLDFPLFGYNHLQSLQSFHQRVYHNPPQVLLCDSALYLLIPQLPLIQIPSFPVH